MRLRRVFSAAIVTALAAASALSVQTKGPSGYTIETPRGWKATANPGGLPELMVVGPRSGGFAPNLNVVVTAAPAGTTLEQIRAATPQMMKSAFSGFKAIGGGSTTVGGTKATYLEYFASMGTPKRPLWYRQVAVIRRGRIYAFTCTTTANGRAASAKALTAMMRSVRWS